MYHVGVTNVEDGWQSVYLNDEITLSRKDPHHMRVGLPLFVVEDQRIFYQSPSPVAGIVERPLQPPFVLCLRLQFLPLFMLNMCPFFRVLVEPPPHTILLPPQPCLNLDRHVTRDHAPNSMRHRAVGSRRADQRRSLCPFHYSPVLLSS